MFLSLSAMGQWENYSIQHFTSTQGLPDNGIRCTAIDQYGFLWVGTQSGLARYDGSRFKIFQSNPLDSTTISGNTIDYIYSDAQGKIWISCHKSGLCRFDPVTQMFKRYFHNPENAGSIPNNAPKYILEDQQQNLWIGFFGKGIAKYNRQNDTFETISFDTSEKNYNYNEGTAAVKDEQGYFWISTRVGVVRFNPIKKSLDKIQHVASAQKVAANNLFISIAWDSIGKQLALGTWDRGITVYDSHQKLWKKYLLDDSIGEGQNRVHQLMFLNENEIIFTAFSQGLGILNLKEEKTQFLSAKDEQLNKEFAEMKIGTSLLKYGRSLFIGSRSGLFHLKMRNSSIYEINGKKFLHPGNLDISILSSALFESDWEHIYSASYYRNGLIAFAKSNGQALHAYYFGDPKENLSISKLLRNPIDKNEMLIASNKGLMCFRPGKDKSLRYYDFQNDSLNKLLQSRYITSLAHDGHGKILIAYHDKLIEWDESKKIAKDWMPYVEERFKLKNYVFNKWIADSAGDFWLINYDHELINFTRSKNHQQAFDINNKLKMIQPRMVKDITFSEPDLLWLAMNNAGLISYNLKNEEIQHYGVKNGLGHSIVKSMVCDEKGRIWVLNEAGISCVFPNNKSVLHFGADEGINLIDQENIELTSDKRIMALGLLNGFYFHPDSLLVRDKKILPSLFLDKITCQTTASSLPLPASEKESLMLDYTENYLSFHFTLPDIEKRNEYLYFAQLRGIDKDWVLLNKEGYVSYSNIQPGKYELFLGVKNSLGEWAAETLKINIQITPPFWKTYWFYSIILILIFFIIWAGIQYRIQWIRRQEQEKRMIQQQINELENQALRSQMNPHFIFNSLNSINSYIIKNKPDEASEYVGKFARLIRLILDNSKESAVTLHNEIAALKLYVEIENKRFSNKFEWNIHVDAEVNIHNTLVPPMIFQPFVENAIWHGLLHKSEQGKLAIVISLKESVLHCEITDNGIGRAAAKELKSKSSLQNKSHGMTLTMKRIENFNKNANVKEAIQIIDLYDENKQAIGTKVILNLTFKIKQENE
jgi:ligand-binding sensor domain-containing protein